MSFSSVVLTLFLYCFQINWVLEGESTIDNKTFKVRVQLNVLRRIFAEDIEVGSPVENITPNINAILSVLVLKSFMYFL